MASDDIYENAAAFVRRPSFNSIGAHSTVHNVQNQPYPDGSEKQATTFQVSCCKSISNKITSTLENAFARFVYYEFFSKICYCITQNI